MVDPILPPAPVVGALTRAVSRTREAGKTTDATSTPKVTALDPLAIAEALRSPYLATP